MEQAIAQLDAVGTGDRRHAHGVWASEDWDFALATAGWTLGPKDDPAYLDRVLPTDGFKALSGLTYDVGRNPDEYGSATQSGYANVSRHAALIMPWLESDDALGWPELWVNRTLDVANRAPEVQGLIGLQWRTQEVMPQLSALARRGWDAGLTSDAFWLDFCVSNFGAEVAAEAAPIFASVDGDAASVDGRALPRFTACCPGAIKGPQSQPWSEYQTQFAFVGQLEALRPRVNGTANRARFDYWLHMFGYLRSGGQIACLLKNYTEANAAAMKIADPQQRVSALRARVLPVRQAMVEVWQELTAHQLQAVNTRGAMGTIQNMEAITKPIILDHPGAALTAALGGEAVQQPSMDYGGANRVFVPNLRTAVAADESLLVEAVVLSKTTPMAVQLFHRDAASNNAPQRQLPEWASTPLQRTTPTVVCGQCALLHPSPLPSTPSAVVTTRLGGSRSFSAARPPPGRGILWRRGRWR